MRHLIYLFWNTETVAMFLLDLTENNTLPSEVVIQGLAIFIIVCRTIWNNSIHKRFIFFVSISSVFEKVSYGSFINTCKRKTHTFFFVNTLFVQIVIRTTWDIHTYVENRSPFKPQERRILTFLADVFI